MIDVKPARMRWIVRLLALVVAALLVFHFLPNIADRLAEKSFGTAIPAGDPEPATMAWAPPWSTAEIGAFVGRGEGLDCSIPPAALAAFSTKANVSGRDLAPVNLRFRQACVAHDLCYRHGRATYGYTQAQCDANLVASAFRLCNYIPGNKVVRDKPMTAEETRAADAADAASLRQCATEARKVLAGVTLGGAGSYRPATDDAGRLGTPAVPLARASTIAEYDPYPQSADFTLPRIGRGWCNGVDDTPVLLTISRRGGGFNVNRYCFDGRKFGAYAAARPVASSTAPRTSPAAAKVVENTDVGSEYRYEPSMPWLTASGGLTRRCRNHYKGTTTGDFARYADALSYAGCQRSGIQTDPDVITMMPVPGDLADRIPAFGMETTTLRHADADAMLPPESRNARDVGAHLRATACMAGARGRRCFVTLPAPCARDSTSSAYYWSATPPATSVLHRSGDPIVALTLFTRGCATDADYQTLRSRTALLDGQGWVPRRNGDAFGPLVEWQVPETAEPITAIGEGSSQRLVSLHAETVPSLHAKLKAANLSLTFGYLFAGLAVALALALTRRSFQWAAALAGLALLFIGVNGVLVRSTGDGFTDNAELAIYPPGGGAPEMRHLLGGRAWLQQRMPIVSDGGRTLILMPRFEQIAVDGHGRLSLDIWIAPVTPAGATAGWHALRGTLPSFLGPESASSTMLVPFRDQSGRLDIVVLGMDGSQAVYYASDSGQDGRFTFRPLSEVPGRNVKQQTA